MSQKKIGISITYINQALNTIIGIVLTPLIIKAYGDDSYSIYKVMQSFSGPLLMFNLGISTIVTRAVVKCKVQDDYSEKDKRNTIAMSMISSSIMAVVIVIAGIVMCGLIPSIYGGNYTSEYLDIGKRIFIIFTVSTIFHILTDSFVGCAIGHEKYAFSPLMMLLKNILRVSLIFVCTVLKAPIEFIACVDCLISVIVFLISAVYSLVFLKEIPKFSYFSKVEFLEMLSFGAAILLQAIVTQVNNSVDTMLLGAMVEEKRIITMYSSALVIYSAYNSFVSVFANFFLPEATKLVVSKSSGEKLTNFVIRPGRFQAMIATAIIAGFALLGRDFITLWIGNQYIDAYFITLILIIPVTIPLVENTAIAILDASLKRMFRSGVLAIMAIVNVAISILLIKAIGFWGAAIGTFISLCIGHILLMNIYYKKTFEMQILRMFREIFKGILPAGAIAALVCLPIVLIMNTSWLCFLITGISFLTVYVVLLFLFGLKKEEKNIILGIIRRRKDKNRG